MTNGNIIFKHLFGLRKVIVTLFSVSLFVFAGYQALRHDRISGDNFEMIIWYCVVLAIGLLAANGLSHLAGIFSKRND